MKQFFLLTVLSFGAFILFSTTTHAQTKTPANARKISGVEKRYFAAKAAQDIVTALKSKMISNELKATLLGRSRPEDKEFAKASVVSWKAYNDRNIHADFDELVVIDDGVEVLRMKPLEGEGEFLINGRKWNRPTSGSIVKSIREHLAAQTSVSFPATPPKPSWERSIFAMLFIPADALATNSGIRPYVITPAFLYANEGMVEEADENLKKIRVGQFFENAPGKDKKELVKIQCEGSTARGHLTIDGAPVDFESRPDGTLVLGLKPKTKLLVISQVEPHPDAGSSLIREEFGVYSCQDVACRQPDLKTLAPDIRPWTHPTTAREALKDVNLALNWRPKDTPDEKTIQRSFGEALVFNPAGLSGRDIKDGQELVRKANIAIFKQLKSPERRALKALRPLGQCCADTSCRASVVEQNLNLIPSSSGATKK